MVVSEIVAVILGVLIAIKFLPTARVAWTKSENMRDFIRGH